ncbi:MAG: 50S ribosomal protein L23 [Spirochaetes bacterium]|nr:50S ribosomal protein L23 [Spirochaetota bacterium]
MRDDEIILKPWVTEKSTSLREKYNKYTFIVYKNVNKITIGNCIQRIFEVKPIHVNIINVKGKKKRVRYKYGYTSSYKKAIVTLKKGEKIGIFEGA